MKIEVEIGDVEIPPGTIGATLRWASRGELYLQPGGRHIQVSPGNQNSGYEVIVFEKYLFPEFIKPGWWIVKMATGSWWCVESEPSRIITTDIDDWRITSKCFLLDHLIWTHPPCTDWRKSLMQKPME